MRPNQTHTTTSGYPGTIRTVSNQNGTKGNTTWSETKSMTRNQNGRTEVTTQERSGTSQGHPSNNQWKSSTNNSGNNGQVTSSYQRNETSSRITKSNVMTSGHTSTQGRVVMNSNQHSSRTTTNAENKRASYGNSNVGNAYNSSETTNGGGKRVSINQGLRVSTINKSGDRLRNSQMLNTGRKSMADYSRARVISTIEGEGQLVEVTEGKAKVVGFNKMDSYVIDTRTFEGESRVIEERELERQVRKSVNYTSGKQTNQEVIIEKVEKIVEIIKSVPVPVEKYVDVEVEVVIDIPIERTIEREKIVETIIEVPEERIIETEVVKVIQIPRKKVFQIDVEVPRDVEVIQEKIVNQYVDNPVESVKYSYKHIDCDEKDLYKYRNQQNCEILETNVNVEHVERIVEVPKERINIIEQQNNVYVDKVIEVETFRRSTRRIPVKNTIIVEKEQIIETPVPREVINYVDKEVIEEYEVVKNVTERIPVEKVVEKMVEFETIVEREVPVYVDNIIEVPKERIVEVEVEEEYIVDVPVENIIENPIEIIKIVEKPIEKIVHKDIDVFNLRENKVLFNVENTNIIERIVNIENKTLNILTIPKEKQIVKPSKVHTTVEVPRERFEEVEIRLVEQNCNIITNENVVEVNKDVDIELERKVERIVVEDVHQNRDRIVDVEVFEYHEVPVKNMVYTDNIKHVETRKCVVNNESKMSTRDEEVEDRQVTTEIEERRQRLEIWAGEGQMLKEKLANVKRSYADWKNKMISSSQQDMLNLMIQYERKMVEYKQSNQKRNALFRKSIRRSNTQSTQKKETHLTVDPRVENLKMRLKQLVQENQQLCDNITYKADGLRKSLRRE